MGLYFLVGWPRRQERPPGKPDPTETLLMDAPTPDSVLGKGTKMAIIIKRFYVRKLRRSINFTTGIQLISEPAHTSEEKNFESNW